MTHFRFAQDEALGYRMLFASLAGGRHQGCSRLRFARVGITGIGRAGAARQRALTESGIDHRLGGRTENAACVLYDNEAGSMESGPA